MKNPLQVIRKQSLEYWSGCIQIQEPEESSISWLVYLLEGRIQYVSTTAGQQVRLNYLWQRFNLGFHSPELYYYRVSEYFQLRKCLADRQMPEETIKYILFNFCQESLTHIGTIEETNVTLIPTKRIANSIFYCNLPQLKLKERMEAWEPLRKYLGTPFTRVYLKKENALKFYKLWQVLYTKPDLESLATSIKLSSFVGLFVTKSTLYEIATKSNTRTYLLAIFLKQCVEENLIDLLPFNKNNNNETTKEKPNKELKIEPVSQQIIAKPVSKIDRTVDRAVGMDKPPKDKDPLCEEVSYKKVSRICDSEVSHKSALILCVDDSKTVQKQVKMTLESVGYQVVGILDPYANLNQIYQYQPAVVFMDINMPNINGYELCSLLKKSEKYKKVPIVMLTGRNGTIDRVRAKLAGAAEYITKPCQPQKLISLVTMLQPSRNEQ